MTSPAVAKVQDFIADTTAKALTRILSDDVVMAKLKDLIGSVIAEKVVPLIPLAVASAVKAVTEQLGRKLNMDTADLFEEVRRDLNIVIPDIDIGIPAIDEILDAWRPHA